MITRVYEIADNCGNTTTCSQTITITDAIAPSLSCPSGLTATCDISEQPAYGDYAAFTAAGGIASDNCGIDASSFRLVSESSDGGSCPEVITRVYEIADNCGNTTTCSQTITITDAIAPSLSCPSGLTATCDISEQPAYGDYAAFTAAGGIASDNCGIDASSFRLVSESSDGGSCPEVITRVYEIADNCGNTTTCSQTITITDAIAPSLSCPSGLTATCDISEQPAYGDYAAFTAAGGIASDNCGIDASSFRLVSESSDGASCPEVITRVYEIADNCGNTTTCSQTITITDAIAPSLSCPGGLTATCDISEQPAYGDYAAFTAAGGIASDNCGIDASSFRLVSESSDGASCPEVITRVYEIADNCGNTTTCSQTITITDAIAPSLSCPGGLTATCDISEQPAYGDYAAFTAAGGIASDNCGIDASSFRLVSESSDGASCPEVITRVYEIADNCGNTTTCSQTITITDAIAPSLSCPSGLTATCDISEQPAYGDYAAFTAAGGIASDNCGIDASSFRLVSESSDGASCPEVITRVYEIADNCGNTTTCSQTITITDAIAPSLSCPGGLTATCDISEQPAYTTYAAFTTAGGSASDNCGIDASSFRLVSESSDGASCPEVITRVYEIADNCGNTTTCSQTITITDAIAPSLSCPGGLTATCDISEQPAYTTYAAFTTAGGSASDNCGIDASSFRLVSESSDGASCPEVITRVYEIADNCGNTTTCSQTITITDAIAPSLSCPSGLTATCDISEQPAYVDYAAFTAGGGIASDNCDIDASSFRLVSETSDGASCPEVITRVYEIADNCGNTTTCSQTITINDDNAPQLVGVPGNTTVTCAEASAGIPTPTVTATDNCDSDVTVTMVESTNPGSCADSYTIIRTWTATDNCGNSSTSSQEIIVGDNAPPVLVGVPTDATVNCNEVPVMPTVTATDDCAINLVVNSNEVTVPGTCLDSYQIIRSWSVRDNCNNEATAEQIITVIDNESPQLVGVPANTTASCTEAGSGIPTPTVTATDNCDSDVTVTMVESTNPGSCADSYTIIRTWTATDNCGNSSTSSQEIIVGDNAPPVLVGVPTDATVNCNEVPVMPTVTATDDCAINLVVNSNEVTVPGTCLDSYQIIRSWSVRDNCNNEATAEQIITVIDNESPQLVGVPANTTASCTEAGSGIPTPTVTATDNCDSDVTVTMVESTNPGSCADSYTIIRTWTATDNCGNSSTSSQEIIVGDNAPPVLVGVPTDATVNCNEVPVMPTVTATDDCATNLVVNSNEVTVPGTCLDSYQIIRSWSVRDNCNNEATAEQIITVIDNESPQLVGVPANTTASCTEAGSGIPTPTVTATDNCDSDVTVTMVESTNPGSCADSYTIIRTWTATDNCGNSSTSSQEIIVGDNAPPVLVGVPTDATVNCNEVPVMPTVTATDDCATNLVVNSNEVTVPGTCLDSYQIIRSWSVRDNCNNEATAEQIITVIDNESPQLVGVPANTTASCTEAGSGIPTPTVTATDNCDSDVTVTMVESTNPGSCADSYTIIRTWTATDNCGNSSTSSQEIIVGDNAPPVLVGVPTDATVNCNEVPVMPTVTATDDCATNLVVNSNEVTVPGTCLDSYQIIRSWSVRDNCNNEATAEQIITVIDNESPQLVGVPANTTASCTEAGSGIPTPTVTATDNCDSDVTVTMVESTNPGSCADSYTIIRTWTATDNCGNSSTSSQEIIVGDNAPPVLVGVPTDATVNCNEVPVMPTVTATDDCAINLVVNSNEVTVPGTCLDSYQIIRSWSVRDNCNNEATAEQIITVIDNESPQLVGVPANTTASCTEAGSGIPTPTVTATDNCDSDVTVTMVESTNPGSCADSYTIIRTWTATDNCGNSSTSSQEIIVGDNAPPVLVGVPTDATVNCNEVPVMPTVTATDDCATNLVVNSNEVTVPGICLDSYQIIRSWSVRDNCNNEATAEQIITVIDNESPQLVGVPANTTASCTEAGSGIPAPTVTATDNCDSDVTVTMVESTNPGSCADSYTIIRTWTATDNCGNTSTASQEIIVGDGAPPVLVGVPGNETVDCDAVPVMATVTATDDCSNNLTVTNNETTNPGTCSGSYEIVRTWETTDDCGNQVTAEQIITVLDRRPPSISNLPADVTLECDEVYPPATPTVSDNCDSDFELTWSEVITPGTCNDSYSLVRTWRATDNCGNISTRSQRITVLDREAPVINAPADITVECTAIPEIPADGVVTTTDNCDGNPTLTFVESITPGTCDDSYTIVRTWTAEDNCGNTSTQSQLITVNDIRPPVITNLPADITLECDEVYPPATPTASDNCDNDPTLTWSEVITPGTCQDSYSLVRTWTATDNCGNTSTKTQRIFVEDTTSPTFNNPPADITVDPAQGETVPDAPVIVDVDDNCDLAPSVSFDESRINGTGCSYIVRRQWMATDNCGNTAEWIQNITVQDELEVNISDNGPVCDGDTLKISVDDGATFNWTGPFGFTSTEQNLVIPNASIFLNSGTYSVTVTSAGGCTAELSTTVEVLRPSFATAASNGPVCQGATLELYGIGGENYSWTGPNGWISTEQFPVIPNIQLDPGTYTYILEITNLDNCASSTSIDVVILEEFTISTVGDQTICEGDDINLNVSGGNNSFYYWEGPNGFTSFEQNPVIPTATTLMSGAYNVTVTSESNCQAATTINVLVEECVCVPPVVIDSLITNATCGLTDGTVELNMLGDPNDYDYNWTPDVGTPGTTENIRTDVPPGSYTIIIADKKNPTCRTEKQVEVGTKSIASSIVVTAQAATCTAANGVATITPANFIYLWLHDNSTLNTRNDLVAGTYQVQFIDPATPACPEVIDVVIESDNPLVAEAIVNSQTSCATADGSAMVNVIAGGSGDYSYGWSDGGSGMVRNNLAAGDYTVTLTDNSTSCDTIMSVTIVSEDFTITASNNGSLCEGLDIQLSTTAGGDSYSWTGPNGFTSNEQNPTIPNSTLTNAGTYAVTVTQGSCVAEASTTVEVLSSLSANASIDSQPDCGEANGAVTINVTSGGSGDYTYSWSDNPVANTNSRNDLSAGTYSVTVIDNSSTCETVVNFTLSADGYSITASNDGPVCEGGTVTLSADNGADSYSWTGPNGFTSTEQNPVINNLTAAGEGTYTLTATQGTCTASATTEVIISGSLTISNNITTEPECGAANGSVTINVDAGGSGNYNFEWSDDGSAVGATRNDLQAGSYTVTVTDTDNGCSAITTFELNNTTQNIEASNNGPICENETIILTATEGGDSYNWTGPNGFTSTERIATIDNAQTDATGIYTVTVITGACTATVSTDVEVNAPATISINNNGPVCDGDTLKIDLDGGESFSWTGPFGFTSTERDIRIPNASIFMNTGTYTVTIIDENGCTQTLSTTIDVLRPSFATTASNGPVCAGADLELYGMGGETYAWTGSNGWTSNEQFPVIPDIQLAPGIYTYTLTITNLDNCTSESSIEVEILDPFTVTVDEDITVCEGEDIQLTVNGSTDNFYMWEGPNGFISFDQNPVIPNASAVHAGTYTLTATSPNNCNDITSVNVTIDECNCTLPNLEAPTIVDASCGNANGSAIINVVGNAEDYNYTWSPDQGTANTNGNSRTGLAAGAYSITVTDKQDATCETVTNITIGNNDGPVVSSNITTPASCDASDGTATLLPANLTYDWLHDGGFGNVRNDLPKGEYQVRVTDPANPACPTFVIVVVGSQNPLVIDATITDANCGQSDGAIALNVQLGSGDYQYDWADAPTINDPNRNNLSAGNYQLTITDNISLCDTILTLTILDSTSGATLTMDSEFFTTCVGANDASVTYDLQTDATFQGTPVIEIVDEFGNLQVDGNLAPGSYCLNVKDEKGCVAAQACFEVKDILFTLEVTSTNKTCEENGTIDLTVTGGAGSYTFNWFDLSGNNNLEDRTDLPVGIYNVTVTDENGCEIIENNIVIADDCTNCAEPEIDNTTITDATCGNGNGQITIEMIGEESNFNYIWSSNVSTTHIASGLAAGAFSVTIENIGDNTCFIVENFTIGNTDGPQVTIDATTPATCEAANGSATLSPANLTYEWLHDGGVGSTRNDLPQGEYQVRITDSANPACPTFVTVVIDSQNPLVVDAIVTDASCGQSDGTIALNVQFGSGDYQHDWADAPTVNAPNRNNLSVGSYQVTITDTNSLCTIERSIAIADDCTNCAEPEIDNTTITDATCGNSNGQITIEMVGEESNFNYIWSSNVSTTHIASGLAAGAFSVTIENIGDNTCFIVENFTIGNTDGPQVTIDATTPATCEAANGSATLSPANLTYEWLHDGGVGSTRNDLPQGEYQVRVTDAANPACPTFVTVVIDSQNPLVVDATVTDASCRQVDGAVALNVQFGSGDYQYDWADAPTVNAPNRNNLSVGSYQVTITDTNSLCTIERTIAIVDDCTNCAEPEIDNTTITDATCGNGNGQITIEMVGEESNFNYIWSSNVSTTHIASGLVAGAFSVTIENAGDNTCFIVENFTIANTDGPQVTIDATTPATCEVADGSATLSPTNLNYEWLHDGGVGSTRNDLSQGEYQVRVTDAANPACPTFVTVTIGANNPLTANATINNHATCGLSDGSITINLQNGSGDYTFVWSDDTNINLSTRNDLAAGTYEVTITDNNSQCTATASVTVLDSAPGATLTMAIEFYTDCAGEDNATVTYDLQTDANFSGTPVIEIRDEKWCTSN